MGEEILRKEDDVLESDIYSKNSKENKTGLNICNVEDLHESHI